MALRLSVAAALFGSSAAWGPDGHTVVAHIADYYLSDDVKAILASDTYNVSLNNVSDWNDDYDHTTEGAWSSALHFINYPGHACKFDWDVDCTVDGKKDWCNVGAIVNYTKQVFDPSLSKENRFIALKFVIHMVGDVHQPLHVSSGDDWGGNKINVAGEHFSTNSSHWSKYKTNLHSIWDSGILVQDIYDIEDNITRLGYVPTYHKWELLANMLEKKMDGEWAAQKKAWQASVAGVRDEAKFRSGLSVVAEESAERSCSYGYNYESGAAVQSDDVLDRTYYERARPIVEEQLAKGGVRLAQILEEALKGSQPPTRVELVV